MSETNVGYIICETTSTETEFKIKADEAGRVQAEGSLQKGEEVNRNKRAYATKELAAQISAPRQRELIKTGNMYGECGHPMTTDLRRQSTIDPTNIQVLYNKIWMEGDTVMGRFMGTFNALGEEFDKSLRFGSLPSFSLRALGSIKQEGGKAYVRNLKLITYDRVIYPSHPSAYTHKLLTEGADVASQLVDTQHDLCIPFRRQQVKDYVMQESANLHTILENFDTLYDTIIVSEDGHHVSMTDINGDRLVIPLEYHIQNEIMNYCSKI